jgi:acid phosphatase
MIAATLALATVLAACAATPTSQPDQDRARPAAAPTRAKTETPTVTKVLAFVVENHSLRQMRRGMPWLNKLAKKYGYATDYRGIRHPSLPNYLAMAGGRTFGVADDLPPADHPISRPSVFGRAIKTGATATTYAEGMTARCQLVNGGRYAVRHNPWTYFTSERKLCRSHDVRLRKLEADVDAGTLPRVGMVIPDLCNDAHDCGLATADRWLHRRVGLVLGGPDFASGNLVVIVTADEDDRHSGNRVLTVVAHPSLDHEVVTKALTHYSLSRAFAEAGGFKPLGRAVGAPSLLAAFGLS